MFYNNIGYNSLDYLKFKIFKDIEDLQYCLENGLIDSFSFTRTIDYYCYVLYLFDTKSVSLINKEGLLLNAKV